MDFLDIIQPDDWHLHLRDGEFLKTVVPHTAEHFARAVIMPNLKEPLTTTQSALAYQERIKMQVPAHLNFEPLMTLYLTDHLKPSEIAVAKSNGVVALKLYPAGATTNSDLGVTNIKHIYPVLEEMQKHGLLLLVHGEVTDQSVDVFDREAVFIDRQLIPLRRDFPGLKIVFEHITTSQACDYVQSVSEGLAATLTAHHLLLNRNAIFKGGLRPHYYCLPVLKRETHRVALLNAASSGDARFFLGSDSAPHLASLKEHASACAGCYTASVAMSLYASAFDAVGRLDQLEKFASLNGPAFYGLRTNTRKLRLKRSTFKVQDSFPYGLGELKPLFAGESLDWSAELLGSVNQ
jgi:dihydroorotase